MSCKNYWAGQVSGRLSLKTHVAPAGVDAADRCFRGDCTELVLQDKGICVGGHRQSLGAKERTGYAVDLAEALLCLVDKLRDGGSGWLEGNVGVILARSALRGYQGKGLENCWLMEVHDRDGDPVEWRTFWDCPREEVDQVAEGIESERDDHEVSIAPVESHVWPVLRPGQSISQVVEEAIVKLMLAFDQVRAFGGLKDGDPRIQVAREFVAAISPDLVRIAGQRSVTRLEKAIAAAEKELARKAGDPGAATYILRDLPETQASGLSDLAWALSREDPHANDVRGLIDLLREARRRWGAHGLAGPRSHSPREIPQPYPWDLPLSGNLLLLDRDGVLVRLKSMANDRMRPVNTSEEVELLPGAVEAILRAQENGAYIALVTNQGGVNLSLDGSPASSWQPVTEQDLAGIHRELLEQLEEAGVDVSPGRFQVYYCPHAVSAGCGCRKPRLGFPGGTGMIGEAMQDFEIDDPAQCLMVGDGVSDFQAAQNAGVRFSLVPTGVGEASQQELSASELSVQTTAISQSITDWVHQAGEANDST